MDLWKSNHPRSDGVSASWIFQGKNNWYLHIQLLYAPPSTTISRYDEMLDAPVLGARRNPKIIASDFKV